MAYIVISRIDPKSKKPDDCTLFEREIAEEIKIYISSHNDIRDDCLSTDNEPLNRESVINKIQELSNLLKDCKELLKIKQISETISIFCSLLIENHFPIWLSKY